MSRLATLVTAALLLAPLSLATGQTAALREAADKNDWHHDYETARREARRLKRPMFLVFRCVP